MSRKNLINHVFFTRKLPNKEADDDKLMLEEFCNLIHNSYAPIVVKKCFSKWQLSQNEDISLNNIEGDSAFYIKEQNSGVLLTRKGDRLVYCDFQCSLKAEQVMDSKAYVSNFPVSYVSIPVFKDLDTIEEELNELADTPFAKAMTKATKSGEKFPEVRDTASSKMMEYFKACLMDSKSSNVDGVVIAKRIRDEVVWKQTLKPFRRSGFYMCLKVVLQLLMIRELGNIDGYVQYKIIILDFHAHFLANSQVNSHLKIEMINKIGRRLCKLAELIPKETSTATKLLFVEKYQSWLNLIGKVNKNRDEMWKALIKQDLKHIPDFSKFNNNDLVYSFDPDLESPTHSKIKSTPRELVYSRHTGADFFNHTVLDDASTDMEITAALYDFEFWMMHQSQNYSKPTHMPKFKVLYASYSAHSDFYAQDPFGKSRMRLFQLAIIRILDECVIDHFPLYNLHNASINPSIINQLLLQTKSEFELAHNLQSHFENRNKADGPGLFHQISLESFNVVFVNQEWDLFEATFNKINEYDNAQATKKKLELENAVALCEEYREAFNKLECVYHVDKEGNRAHGKSKFSRVCDNCKFKKWYRDAKVALFEKCLSLDNIANTAALFELCIPEAIGVLRDVLYTFNKSIKSIVETGDSLGNWTKILFKFTSRSSETEVTLGSSLKLFTKSHYKEYHPIENDGSSFIVDCGFNAKLACNGSTIAYRPDYTIDIGLPIIAPYSSLAFCVKQCNYSQNDIIANQDKCPPELTLKEFMAFGTLRCGQNLQWRHLYRYFKDLNTNNQSVLNLILTAIFKCQDNKSVNYIRDAHLDLECPSFVAELIKLLELIIEEQRHNWKNYYSMLCIVFISRRLVDINKEAISLLLKIRSLMNDWSLVLFDLFKVQSDLEPLYITTIHVRIITLLTFGYDALDDDAMLIWLRSVVDIKEKCLLINYSILPIYCHLIHFIGYKLLPEFEACIDAFDDYIVEYYDNIACKLDYKSHQIFKFTNGPVVIQIDTIFGDFLVDYAPVGYLSATITNHPYYIQIFGIKILPCLKFNLGYKSTELFNNCYYSFEFDEEDDLVIKELHYEKEYQFIPIDKFYNCPYQLHALLPWYDENESIVEFRLNNIVKYVLENDYIRVEMQKDNKIKFTNVPEFESDLNKFLVQLNRPCYEDVIKVFEAIEIPEYIHVYWSGQLLIELPRYKLKFTTKKTKYYCTELRMEVSNKQINTLVGLKNKLVLENELGDVCVIIPHGPLILTKTEEHVKVQVDLNNMYDVHYFNYKLDFILQRLMPSNTMEAWLYLILLHATTSHALVDPFTGLTGCEQALLLLQLGNIKSCKPYSPHSLRLLQLIAALTPVYKYYPVHLRVMMDVTFNNNLHDYACHDAYYLIVKDLITKSQELGFLYEDTLKFNLHDNNIDLISRHINRCGYSYANEARLFYNPVVSIPIKINILPDPDVLLLTICIRMNHFVKHEIDLSFFKDLDMLEANDLVFTNFNHSWFYLYTMALSSTNLEEWIFIINSFYYKKNVPISKLMLLQSIRANKSKFPPVLQIQSFEKTKNTFIKRDDLKLAMSDHKIKFDDYLLNQQHLQEINESDQTFELRVLDAFEAACDKEMNMILSKIVNKWPATMDFNDFIVADYKLIQIMEALPIINTFLLRWIKNNKLHVFIDEVESICHSLVPNKPPKSPIIQNTQNSFKIQNKQPYVLQMTSKYEAEAYQSTIYNTGILKPHIDYFKHAQPQNKNCPFTDSDNKIQSHMVHLIKESWDAYMQLQLRDSFDKAGYVKYQNELFQFYKSSNLTLLAIINKQQRTHASLIHIEPRKTPITLCRLLLNPIYKDNALIGAFVVTLTYQQQALRCIKYANTNMNHQIYKETAFQFKPINHPYFALLQLEMDVMFRKPQVDIALNFKDIMQLQMGEGKTSCILPMLAVLPRISKICQIVVLKSLYHLNYDLLKYKIGYLLNKQVFTFPCHRLIKMTNTNVQFLLNQYKQCLNSHNVIITTPEYVQSFHLKCIEMCFKSSTTSDIYIKLHNFNKTNIFNILDESDEILHYKHQLVYTIGTKQMIDGGAERYLDIERVLMAFYNGVFKTLHWEVEAFKTHSKIFVMQLISGNVLYLPEINKLEMFEFVIDPESKLGFTHQTLLILRGLFAYDLLFLALKKRFRVNYGINNKFKTMAIPFKAKDTPTEQTEFGHTDMAIVLTLLSYYQYGLTNLELTRIFNHADKLQNKHDLYYIWTGTEQEINLLDEGFKINLFRQLRNNMHVIHYYLNKFVFCKELKQYPYLLTSTGWDFENSSGFSGTNDTELLLPNIKQNNLKSLCYTNAEVLCNILQNKDKVYKGDTSSILPILHGQGVQLLIDCGALFKIRNKQVAIKWLEISQLQYNACLYFDKDRLMVIDLMGHLQEYENSAYKHNLSNCLIYLDDHHTRGVDLQLPVDFNGAVTISHELTKDKFVQSCMRMRLLGTTHKLIFIASEQAHLKLNLEGGVSQIVSILDFCMKNTVEEIENNFLRWASAGLYHYYKECCYALLLENKELRKYGEMCLLPESTDLDTYKMPRMQQLVVEIINDVYKGYFNKLAPFKMENEYFKKSKFILDQCALYVPDLKYYKQLFNAEQQRELETEVEEEVDYDNLRPKEAEAVVEIFDDKLVGLIQSGDITSAHSNMFQLFYKNINKLRLFNGKSKLIMTNNFSKTTKSFGMDYLREPLWLIEMKEWLIMITPFEADNLIQIFRNDLETASLRIFQPKSSPYTDTMIENKGLILGTPQSLDLMTLTHLHLFSGALYFDNKQQQDAFASVIGYIARPRNDKEEEIFNKGHVEDGYLKNEFHREFGLACLFRDNPIEIVKELINVRVGQYDVNSHVAKLLLGVKTFVKDVKSENEQ